MFDIGFAELLVIGIVALIVVGPKDLPGMFRTLGRFTGKMRGMAREFQRAMNEAADSTGMGDVAKDLKAATNPKKMGLDKLNQAAENFEKWDPVKSAKERGAGAEKGPEKCPETHKYAKERAAAAEKMKEVALARKAEREAAENAPAPTDNAEATPPPAEKKPEGDSAA